MKPLSIPVGAIRRLEITKWRALRSTPLHFLLFTLCLAGLLLHQLSIVAATTYYVDSAGGSDSNDGSRQHPWKTIFKVNSSSSSFRPGDSILFKRGDAWTQTNGGTTLYVTSGDANGYITYSAYGRGAKPLLTMSMNRGDPSDWRNIGGNIWSTGDTLSEADTTGSELLHNSSFDRGSSGWSLYTNARAGAIAAGNRTTHPNEVDSPPAGFKINVTNNGRSLSDIQLYTRGISIVGGDYYMLSFAAKSSTNFTIPYITLMNDTLSYASDGMCHIRTTWRTHHFIFLAPTADNNARITLYLGSVIPNNTTLYIDSLSMKRINGTFIYTDVGNIIMSHKTHFGVKVWKFSDLKSQGQFFYDQKHQTLQVYSVENPATYYNNDILIVMKPPIVDLQNQRYVIIDGLAISMGGSLGISMSHSNNIIIRRCDVSYIGGSDQYSDGIHTIRYGNGIQLWQDGRNIYVYNNTISNIYDAALTAQGEGRPSLIHDLYFHNNIIWNAEYGIEFWERPASSIVRNVYFDNNTIIDSGRGWGHNQRPDGVNGHAFISYFNPAKLTHIYIRNNVFYNATQSTYRFNSLMWLPKSTIDYNHYGGNVDFIQLDNPPRSYSIDQLNIWRIASGQDIHSFVSNESPIDYTHRTTNVAHDSPDIDSGTLLSYINTDFNGNPIYGAPVGAYSFQPHYTIGNDMVDIRAGARIYSDGKFRDLRTPSGCKANLTITPLGGSFPKYKRTDRRSVWIDIKDIVYWTTNHKSWTEGNAERVSLVTYHRVGDLKPMSTYTVRVDGASATDAIVSGPDCSSGVCTSNESGQITFVYRGGFSAHTHSFDLNLNP